MFLATDTPVSVYMHFSPTWYNKKRKMKNKKRKEEQ